MVVVMVVGPVAAPQPLAQHGGADCNDEQTGDQGQPRVQLVGHDEPGEQERDESEPEDAGRVRDRHRRSEEERVPRLPLRPHEVAGDERLPVPRGQRVDGSPERRDQQRDQDHAEREISSLDERLERLALMHGSGADLDHRGE